MGLASPLIDQVNSYLNQRIRLSNLEEWLVPRLAEYLRLPQSPEGELVGVIELCLAEMNDGIRTEAGIRKTLAAYLKKMAEQSKEVAPTP